MTVWMRSRSIGLWIAAALSLAAPAMADVQVVIETVALSGDPAPGVSGSVSFDTFGLPVLDESGDVAFTSGLAGDVVPNIDDTGLFGPDASGTIALIAQRWDPAGSGDLFDTFGATRPTTPNVFLFRAEDTAPWAGIWRSVLPGSPVRLAKVGWPLPGTGATAVDQIGSVLLNELGEGLFAADFGGFDEGIWHIDAAGNVAPVALDGDPAPGIAGGVVFSGFLTQMSLSDAGDLAFHGSVSGPGVTGSNGQGLWSRTPGGPLVLRVRGGDAAPGAAIGETFLNFSGGPLVNGAGELAFQGILEGPGVTGSNNTGIWGPDVGGSPMLKAREGDPAPGTEAGTTFASFVSPHALTDDGSLAFLATLAGPSVTGANGAAIWIADRAGSLTLLLRSADAITGLPPGVLVGSLSEPPRMNQQEQLLLSAYLTGAGVDATNNQAIVLIDPQDGPVVVLREGDLLEVAPGDVRTVRFVGIWSAYADRLGLRSLNDAGQIALSVRFADDSEGILLARTVTAVPSLGAPAAALMAATLIAGAWRGTRRRARR